MRLPRIVDGVLFDPPGRRRKLRLAVGTLTGLAFGHLFWSYVLIDLGAPEPIASALRAIVYATLTVGYPLARCVRSCTWLLVLGFAGRAGRTYIKALIIAAVLAGPMLNLTLNGKEVVRVFGCSARLTLNLTRTRMRLMTAPFRRTLRNLPNNVTQINRAFGSVDRVVQPLREELEDDGGGDVTTTTTELLPFSTTHWPYDNVSVSTTATNRIRHSADAQRTERIYRDKIRRRCRALIERARLRCVRTFRDAYVRCKRRLPPVVGPILCAPMRLSVVCALGVRLAKGGVGNVCEPGANVIGPELGPNYAELNNLTAQVQPVRVRTTHVRRNEWRAVKRRTDRTRAQIYADFRGKWHLIRWYVFVMRKILALVFVRVVYGAWAYHRRYHRDITYDNVYVTNYFRRIEGRRRRRSEADGLNLMLLLPPRRIERSELVAVWTCARSAREWWPMMAQMCVVLLEMCVSLCVLLLDHLVVVALEIIRRHAVVEFEQHGEHVVDVRVNGTGIVAQIVRQAVETLSMRVHVHEWTDNRRCLPRPQRLAARAYVQMAALYAVLLAMLWAETYVQRQRHCVEAYFYYAREKQRVLYLYNECLKRKRGLMARLRRRVVEKVREGRWMGAGGGLCSCLWRWLPGCRRRCTVCDEVERMWLCVRTAESAIECAMCWTIYCAQCWRELEAMCLVCSAREEERLVGFRNGGDDGGGWSSDED